MSKEFLGKQIDQKLFTVLHCPRYLARRLGALHNKLQIVVFITTTRTTTPQICIFNKKKTIVLHAPHVHFFVVLATKTT